VTSKLVSEMLDWGILERIKYTESEIADSDPSEPLPLVSMTKGFLVFLYEMKKSPIENRHITDEVSRRRKDDVIRALYLWLKDHNVQGSQDIEGMTNIAHRYLVEIEKEFPILLQMDVRSEIDSLL
jgi:hypothetical protein